MLHVILIQKLVHIKTLCVKQTIYNTNPHRIHRADCSIHNRSSRWAYPSNRSRSVNVSNAILECAVTYVRRKCMELAARQSSERQENANAAGHIVPYLSNRRNRHDHDRTMTHEDTEWILGGYYICFPILFDHLQCSKKEENYMLAACQSPVLSPRGTCRANRPRDPLSNGTGALYFKFL